MISAEAPVLFAKVGRGTRARPNQKCMHATLSAEHAAHGEKRWRCLSTVVGSVSLKARVRVLLVVAQACEMFILELTLRAWNHAEENKRRTLQRLDVAAAITRTDIFDFLVGAHSRAYACRGHACCMGPYHAMVSFSCLGCKSMLVGGNCAVTNNFLPLPLTGHTNAKMGMLVARGAKVLIWTQKSLCNKHNHSGRKQGG